MDTFADRPNLALRGLYWLSFDIVGSKGQEDDAIEPGAVHLNTLRNALEHRCLILTDRPGEATAASPMEHEQIEAFRDHTVRMLEIAHEALILLSLAMHEEERRQASKNIGLTVEMYLPGYDGAAL